jgi:hypothetical protein
MQQAKCMQNSLCKAEKPLAIANSRYSHCIALVVLISGLAIAQSNPSPIVSQALDPVSAKPASGAFSLTVNGSGFAPTAVVNWNGSPRTTAVMSAVQLKASITAADVAKAQTAWITVTNPAPGGGTSAPVFFPVRETFTSVALVGKQVFSPPSAVVAGDFNNDRKLDIAWVGPWVLNVSLGNGNGTFQPAVSTSLTLVLPSRMVTGDFNGDGKLDVFAIDDANASQIFLGNGDGTFTLDPVKIGAGVGNFIGAADVFQEGVSDIYVTGWDTAKQWFDTLGGRYFTSYFAGSPAFGDFNGDGPLDLAVPSGSGDGAKGVDIFLANTSHVFTELGQQPGGSRQYVATGDMNHDGKLDLITDLGGVMLGNGDGTFGFPEGTGCSCTGPIFGIGDFDGDGNLDSVLVSSPTVQSPESIAIVLGAGDGTTKGVSLTPAIATTGSVGDFNNDGMLDVVLGSGVLLLQTTAKLSPLSVTFTNQNVGTTSVPQVATLTNVGTTTLVINKVILTGTNSASFAQTNNCGTSLAAGASCAISITFSPRKSGVLAAAVVVSYGGVGSPQQIALGGTGVTAPTVTLSPARLKYSTQLVGTTSAANTATLTNTSTQTVTISGISITAAFSQANNCPASLRSGRSCQIQVVYQPVAKGPATGTLSVADNATGSPQEVMLGGVATVVTLSPEGLNFGDQKVGTTSAAFAVTLVNHGTTALSISQIAFTGTNPTDFVQTNDCGSSVAASGSCTINVSFKPAATGARAASLSVSDNGGASPQSIPVAGTGT